MQFPPNPERERCITEIPRESIGPRGLTILWSGHKRKRDIKNGHMSILTRWIGSKNQVKESSQIASDLISESITCWESQTHNTVYGGDVKNNVGFLLFRLGRFQAASNYLTEARRLAVKAKDKILVAQFDDSLAKLFIGTKQLKKQKRQHVDLSTC
jgi:hypothetical protein